MHEKNALSIKKFVNEQFGNIRTIMISGVPWFAGKDVASALGYTNPQKAIKDHVDEDDRTVNDSFTVHGTKGMLINESGLYSLVISSRLPNAKQFKHWITSEVLPALRQTGAYIQPGKEDQMVENYLPNLPSDVKDSIIKSIREQNVSLIAERNALRENLQEIKMANIAMASGILTWEDRKRLCAAVRKLGGMTRHYAGTIWNELYRQLYYKHGISLKARGGSPYTQWIKEDEWHNVIESFCAICEAYGVSAGTVFKETHIDVA